MQTSISVGTLFYKLLYRIKFAMRKFFHATYYSFLFGRHFPFQRIVSRTFHAWEKQWRKGDIPVSREVWESEYFNDHWKFMKDLDELPRYSIIAGYFRYFKSGGSLLDVGCGEGILQEKLGPCYYSKYVGIDVSEAAIDQAALRNDDKTVFVCDNALNYTSTERFDAIVFNEILYYFDEPLQVLEKYKQYLKDDGIIITSLYLNSERATSIWKRLKTIYFSLDEVKAANKSKTWVFNVFVDSTAIAQ